MLQFGIWAGTEMVSDNGNSNTAVIHWGGGGGGGGGRWGQDRGAEEGGRGSGGRRGGPGGHNYLKF